MSMSRIIFGRHHRSRVSGTKKKNPVCKASAEYCARGRRGAHSPSPRPSPIGYVSAVAQIFNLLYRRLVIRNASDRSHGPWFPDDWQSATLRYSRLQVCATGVGNSVNRYLGLLLDGASPLAITQKRG